MHDAVVGLIGLGARHGVAARLLAEGNELLFLEDESDGAEELVELGAEAVAVLGELIERSDVVLLYLEDTDVMNEFVLGTEGMATFAADDQILVDLSATAPAATRWLAHELARRSGMAWIDAPFIVEPDDAGGEDLCLVVGGSEEDVALVRPLLECFASRVTHMGEAGSGQATRLCHAMLAGATVLAIAETLVWAERNGVDAERLAAALAETPADSLLLQQVGASMAVREVAPASLTTAALRRSLEQALECARDTGTALPMVALATQLLYQHGLRESPDQDLGALVELYTESDR